VCCSEPGLVDPGGWLKEGRFSEPPLSLSFK
jgi:hypothetical protein